MTDDDGVILVQAAKRMLGQIPGLISVEIGSATEVTKARAHGYDWGVVVTLAKPEDEEVYTKHPAHDE